MLKTEFWKFVKNESELVGVDMHGKDEPAAYLWHLAHCYDYLRRHVVCNMDMSLEWPTLGGTNEGTINGYEIAHTCKKRVSTHLSTTACSDMSFRDLSMSIWISMKQTRGWSMIRICTSMSMAIVISSLDGVENARRGNISCGSRTHQILAFILDSQIRIACLGIL